MVFMQHLAHAGKIAQGLFVARKKSRRTDRTPRMQGMGREAGAARSRIRMRRPSSGDVSAAMEAVTERCLPFSRGAAAATSADPSAWFDHMIENCLQYATGGEGGGPAGRRHPVRVHAARADHGGRRRAGLPVRRIGQDDSRRPKSTCRPTSAR